VKHFPQAYMRAEDGSTEARKCENRDQAIKPYAVCRKRWRLHPYTMKLAFSGTQYLIRKSSGSPRCASTDNGTFLPDGY
jgi:hypothetical protein